MFRPQPLKRDAGIFPLSFPSSTTAVLLGRAGKFIVVVPSPPSSSCTSFRLALVPSWTRLCHLYRSSTPVPLVPLRLSLHGHRELLRRGQALPEALSFISFASLWPSDAHRPVLSLVPSLDALERTLLPCLPLLARHCTWAALHRPSPAAIHPSTGAPGHGDAPVPFPHRRQTSIGRKSPFPTTSSAPNRDQGLRVTIEAFLGANCTDHDLDESVL
jgi:hypothetical protein